MEYIEHKYCECWQKLKINLKPDVPYKYGTDYIFQWSSEVTLANLREYWCKINNK